MSSVRHRKRLSIFGPPHPRRSKAAPVPHIELRPATIADYDFAFRVHCAAMRPCVEQTYGWNQDWQAGYFRQRFDPAEREIIRCDGIEVGVVSANETEGSLFLSSIALLPRYQNKGIGTAVIRNIQAEAREMGMPLTLQVLKVNPARNLYERLGFRVTGETDTHYLMIWSTSTE